MAYVGKRLSNSLAHYLADNEKIESAILVRPIESFGTNGERTQKHPIRKSYSHRSGHVHKDRGGLAGSFPSGRFLLARTNLQYIVIEPDGLHFIRPERRVPLKDMKIHKLGGSLFTTSIKLEFSDGSALIVKAGRHQAVDHFLV